MAERAGLENRRWGDPSASSNLAPSASTVHVCEEVLSNTPIQIAATGSSALVRLHEYIRRSVILPV